MNIRGIYSFLSFAVLLTLASACPSLNSTEHPLHKRWHSVELNQDANGNYLTPGPWPPISGRSNQPLRYCFGDEDDFKKLNVIVLAAINLWKPAISPNSNLVIVPDKGSADQACICGTEGVRGDALNVQDYTEKQYTQATVGWDPNKQGAKNNDWHQFMFARVDTTLDDSDQATKAGEKDIVRMAHEIGHALGLEHEHQRPDAAKYMELDCTMLMDYDDFVKKVGADKVKKACTDLDTALGIGWDSVSQRLPIPQQQAIGGLAYSTDPDLLSIMMYGSYDSHRRYLPSTSTEVDPKKFPSGAVLKSFTQKKPKLGKPKDKVYSRVYMGGKDPRSVDRVSEGDVGRIQTLYPLPGAAGPSKQGGGWRSGILPKVGGGSGKGKGKAGS